MRIFALTPDKTKMNVTMMTDADTDAAMSWEQIGPDIVESDDVISVSLTDNLILAIGYREKVVIYQFDNKNQTAWVRLGQEVPVIGNWMQLVESTNSGGKMVLAVGTYLTVSIYEFYDDSWIVVANLAADDATASDIVFFSLAMDGETIAIGKHGDFEYIARGLRIFSYNATLNQWEHMGKDLESSLYYFNHIFSLSGNGKVLVASTWTGSLEDLQRRGDWPDFNHIRTFDFTDTAGGGEEGEWIQREAVLEWGLHVLKVVITNGTLPCQQMATAWWWVPFLIFNRERSGCLSIHSYSIVLRHESYID
jgi:hypothetical protein